MQRHLYEHFQVPGHTGLFEHYWIHTLKTKAPIGLMLKVVTELLSYIVIEQLFLFLDLGGMF